MEGDQHNVVAPTYIDFETLGRTRDPDTSFRPLLLGTLRDAAHGGFQQAVLDPALHSAVRASKDLAAHSVASAIDFLAREEKGVASGRIVAWSTYDLSVITRHCQSQARLDEIRARYENALEDARRWRREVRPSVKLPLDHKGRQTHELKAYMSHVGYPVPRALAPGNAARWGAYVLEQVGKTAGGYPEVKALAKRRWHYLLEYNFHDCAGLRAVHERVSRELALWEAYRKTTFRIFDAAGDIDVQIGWNPKGLQKLLERERVWCWAFITAWNPGSTPLSKAENERRQSELVQKASRWTTIRGAGVGQDSTWPPEESLCILGISRGAALALGRQFGQLGIVWGKRDGRAELVPCEPPIPSL
jgi:hypothetical protein